jgi:hypothetical protein
MEMKKSRFCDSVLFKDHPYCRNLFARGIVNFLASFNKTEESLKTFYLNLNICREKMDNLLQKLNSPIGRALVGAAIGYWTMRTNKVAIAAFAIGGYFWDKLKTLIRL